MPFRVGRRRVRPVGGTRSRDREVDRRQKERRGGDVDVVGRHLQEHGRREDPRRRRRPGPSAVGRRPGERSPPSRAPLRSQTVSAPKSTRRSSGSIARSAMISVSTTCGYVDTYGMSSGTTSSRARRGRSRRRAGDTRARPIARPAASERRGGRSTAPSRPLRGSARSLESDELAQRQRALDAGAGDRRRQDGRPDGAAEQGGAGQAVDRSQHAHGGNRQRDREHGAGQRSDRSRALPGRRVRPAARPRRRRRARRSGADPRDRTWGWDAIPAMTAGRPSRRRGGTRLATRSEAQCHTRRRGVRMGRTQRGMRAIDAADEEIDAPGERQPGDRPDGVPGEVLPRGIASERHAGGIDELLPRARRERERRPRSPGPPSARRRSRRRSRRSSPRPAPRPTSKWRALSREIQGSGSAASDAREKRVRPR